ncbi:DUF2975 domain-containing protein [Salimicrobium flavidum]|nr:DUF2975 domain-containing protein [Salimicrobium flavidum]
MRETIFLKVVLILMALPVVAVSALWIPWFIKEVVMYYLDIDAFGYAVALALYLTEIAYFIALFQAWKLLGFIDKKQTFSFVSVKALKVIKYCATVISGLYVLMMPLLFIIGDEDDAPGVVAIGLIIIFASFVIAAFAAVLQKLLKSAVDIKSVNDLTV